MLCWLRKYGHTPAQMAAKWNRGSIIMTQGSFWVTRGHGEAVHFTQHLKRHQQAVLVLLFWPSTSTFLLLNQPASVGVALFSCYKKIREQPWLKHCLSKGMRTVWLVYNNMLSGRICDLKEKRMKIENRQKRGDGGSRTRATWIEQWWGAYKHQQ